MNGLALSERHYRECCAPMLEERFPALRGRVAAGPATVSSPASGDGCRFSDLAGRPLGRQGNFLQEHALALQNRIDGDELRDLDLLIA